MICGQNRQSPEREKTLSSYTPHTLLATRIYKLHKFSMKKKAANQQMGKYQLDSFQKKEKRDINGQ